MITMLMASTALAFLTQVSSAIMPPTTVQVAQWSTYEMTLTATDTYDTYASVDLTGVFTGPDGRAVEVKGFWDGGATFKIRFTPTVEGLWTFMTVSDDPGLDGRLGNITVMKATSGTHGFVRQATDGSGQWQFDDETRATRGVMALPAIDHPDLAGLRALDRQVVSASAAGRVAGVVLFDTNKISATEVPETELYQYVQYMTARFGAFPNVVWCLHPAAAKAGTEKFWRVAAQMTSALDPYFASTTDRARVMLQSCTSEPASSPSPLLESGVQFGRDPAHIVLAGQTFPNPVQTKAVAGTVRKGDEAAGHVIGRAVDAIGGLVHGTPTTDLFEGLKEGSQVIVHDVADDGRKAAREANHLKEDGQDAIEGRVTHIDRGKKELTLAFEDGSKETLHLTERAVADADDAAAAATKVIVSYTDAGGEAVVEMFRRVR